MDKDEIAPSEGEVKTAEEAQAAIENEAEADATAPLDESEEEYVVEATEDSVDTEDSEDEEGEADEEEE